jgi:hypothetical protein
MLEKDTEPTPSLAPGIKPGMSAMTKLSPGPGAAKLDHPSVGWSINEGMSAIFGLAAETFATNVLLPTLGKPSSPRRP